MKQDAGKIISTRDMQDLERGVMDAGKVTGLALMERAGMGAVCALVRHWSDMEASSARAVIQCGPGNNGGDGFVMARLLQSRGWAVTVFAFGWDWLVGGGDAEGSRVPDACANAKRWIDDGGAVHSLPAEDAAEALVRSMQDGTGPVVLIDALLGIGQSRSADAILAPIVSALANLQTDDQPFDVRAASVDIPTGLHTDTCEALGADVFPAEFVITFHARKAVHVRLEEQGASVSLVDIGL